MKLEELASLPADWQRGALPPPERRARVLDWMQRQPRPPAHPFGLDLAVGGPELWAPYAAARDRVELYASGGQEPGCQVDWLDLSEGRLEVGLALELPSKCARFTGRACPRMAPMGHESEQSDCNYWAWERMAELTPKLELYPEWQRFDCHKYYPLFQAHLVGEALAEALALEPRWRLLARPEAGPLLKVYAGLTSRPDAFVFEALP